MFPSQIRNGDNIAYLYATSLPKLFYYSPPLDVPEDFSKEKLIKLSVVIGLNDKRLQYLSLAVCNLSCYLHLVNAQVSW